MSKSVPTAAELLSLAPVNGRGFTAKTAQVFLRRRLLLLHEGNDPTWVATELMEFARATLGVPYRHYVTVVACDCKYDGGILGNVLELVLTTGDFRSLIYDVRKDSWRIAGVGPVKPPRGCTATMEWECKE